MYEFKYLIIAVLICAVNHYEVEADLQGSDHKIVSNIKQEYSVHYNNRPGKKGTGIQVKTDENDLILKWNDDIRRQQNEEIILDSQKIGDYKRNTRNANDNQQTFSHIDQHNNKFSDHNEFVHHSISFNKRGHEHGHPHEHAHPHEHPHPHPHEHPHPHPHEHTHPHPHVHAHPHGHDHTHKHEHSHKHDHAHEHEHPHEHGHMHQHSHTHQHKHSHGHMHGHSHKHEHGLY